MNKEAVNRNADLNNDGSNSYGSSRDFAKNNFAARKGTSTQITRTVQSCECFHENDNNYYNGSKEAEQEDEYFSMERFFNLSRVKSFGGDWFQNLVSTFYCISKCIGEGKRSKVYFSECNKTKINYAVKRIVRQSVTCCEMERIGKAVQNHMKINKHKNVIECYGAFIDKKYIYIFLEYANKYDLHTKIISQREMRETEISTIIKQIVLGVHHCHEQGVVHRDLKPANIVFHSDDGVSEVLKIIDFGLSAPLGLCRLVKGFCGTSGYRAPELLEDRPIGPPADLYAVGVILYNLLFKCFPYDPKNRLARESEIQFPHNRFISIEAESIVKGLLHHNPHVRYTVEDVLGHPFITRTLESTPSSLLTLHMNEAL